MVEVFTLPPSPSDAQGQVQEFVPTYRLELAQPAEADFSDLLSFIYKPGVLQSTRQE